MNLFLLSVFSSILLSNSFPFGNIFLLKRNFSKIFLSLDCYNSSSSFLLENHFFKKNNIAIDNALNPNNDIFSDIDLYMFLLVI